MRNIKFINAGAGSGKTYKLIDTLASWVEEKGNNANEILLTTFTKKAANEIRERAQSRLLSKDNFDQANKLEDAVLGTVHSVGYQFISKYWYLIGSSPELKEITDYEKDIYFTQAISEVPTEEELNQLFYLSNQFDFHNNKNHKDPNIWKEHVQEIMNSSLLNNIDILNSEDSLSASKQKIESFFKGGKDINQIPSILEEIKKILENNGTRKREDALKEYERLQNIKSIDLSYIIGVGRLMKLLNLVYPDNNRYKEVRSRFPNFNIQDFKLFKESLVEYIELVFRVARGSISKYQNFKKEKGLVDFMDMEVHFLKLLDEDIVQKEIKETIKIVMVDEFQDSNPIQLAIFMKLSNLVNYSYWVGDPKQAIYGFRGSDPELIEQIIREFTKKNDTNLSIDVLKMSWRSEPTIVNFVNEVFEGRLLEQASNIYLEDKSQIIGQNKEFKKWLEKVDIKPLQGKDTIGLIPARNKSTDPQGSAIKFWSFLNHGKNGNLTNLKKEIYFEKLSEKVISILQKGQNGEFNILDKDSGEYRAIMGSDICILVSSNDNVLDLTKTIQNQGFEVNAEVDGLRETVEYRILQNIITLFFDKNHALSLTELAYLSGENESIDKLINERIDLLNRLSHEKEEDSNYDFYKALNTWLEKAEFRDRIDHLRKQATHLSVYYTLEKIIGQFNMFQHLLNFKNSALRQENIMKLLNLAEEYENYCLNINLGSSLVGYLKFLDANEGFDKQSKNSSINGINIMTYHKSKGLEWPVVILSDLQKDSMKEFEKKEFFSTKIINNSKLNVSSPLQGRLIEFSFWPFGTSKTVNEELKDLLMKSDSYNLKTKNKLNEQSRLMYVGQTRARDYLIFSSNQAKGLKWLEDVIKEWKLENILDKINAQNIVRDTVNFFNLPSGQPVEYEKILSDTPILEGSVPTDEKKEFYFLKENPVKQAKPYLLNPSKTSSIENTVVRDIVQIHPRLQTNTTLSTELGNILHEMLYLKDRSYFKTAIDRSNVLSDLNINKTQLIENTQAFNQWIKRKNPLFEYCEIALEMKVNNQLARGEADLVIETNDGLILVDYKSYPGGDEISNPSSDFYAGKYSGQLELYSKMLEEKFTKKRVVEKYIYYIVQGKMVKIEIE